jgi:hydroxymethylbilane synthase
MQRPETTRPALRIGTRGSELALVQARWVAERLAGVGVPTELVIMRTEGDDRAPDTAWGEGAFVTAIERALLEARIDLAVHSAKDVPTEEDARLVIAAFPPREDPRDSLVCRERGGTLATLPRGARVGTDSPRRTAFLSSVRPDLRLHPLHGNVDTRLRKLDAGESDALVLAVAGLTRLGRADRIDDILPPELAAPAPGQGALAIQVRTDDAFARAAVGRLDDADARAAVESERAFLRATGGGCRSPIGALATVDDDRLTLRAAAARDLPVDPTVRAHLDPIVRVSITGPVADHLLLARALAERVVRLRTRPRVLVTRPDAQAAALVAALEARGLESVVVPTIEIQPVAAGGELDTRAADLAGYDWTIVTSANGAQAMLDAARRSGVDPTVTRWAAVGEATAMVLAAAGVGEPFRPSRSSGRAIADQLPLGSGERVLLARADIADGTLPDGLRARGAAVDEVDAYRTLEAPEPSRARLSSALADGPIDGIVVTSGSTLRGLLALAGEGVSSRIRASLTVCIGPSTAAVARDLGFEWLVEAPMQRADSLADAVAAALTMPQGGPG